MRLLRDHHDAASEALSAQMLRRAATGLAAADDHEAAVILREGGFRRLNLDGGRLQIDENIVALALDPVGGEPPGDRGALRLAGADVELPLMQRAFDAAILDIALRQEGELMGTDIVGGVNLAIEQIECHRRTGDIDTDDTTFFQIAKRRCAQPAHIFKPVLPWQ